MSMLERSREEGRSVVNCSLSSSAGRRWTDAPLTGGGRPSLPL